MWKVTKLDEFTYYNHTSRKRRDKTKWYATLEDHESGHTLDAIEVWSEHYFTMLKAGFSNPPAAAAEGELYVMLNASNKIEAVYRADGGLLTVADARAKGRQEVYFGI